MGAARARSSLGEQGDHKSAEALFEESMELFLRLGDHAPAGGRMTFLAYYAARDGDLDRAESLLERATEQYRLAGDLAGVGGCIRSLGDIDLERGDVRSALDRYRESRPILIQGGSSLDVAYELAGTAAVAALLGHPEVAARLWGAFLRLESESERSLDADDRVRYERALGEVDEANVAAGRELSDDEALELARATADELARSRNRPHLRSRRRRNPRRLRNRRRRPSRPSQSPGLHTHRPGPRRSSPRNEPASRPGRSPPP